MCRRISGCRVHSGVGGGSQAEAGSPWYKLYLQLFSRSLCCFPTQLGLLTAVRACGRTGVLAEVSWRGGRSRVVADPSLPATATALWGGCSEQESRGPTLAGVVHLSFLLSLGTLGVPRLF